MSGRTSVVLTVGDHDKNGFIALARWPYPTEQEARAFIASVDAQVDDDSEPDLRTASYTFILDLCEGNDTIDNGKRLLPTQVAMSLAPALVQQWLTERPEPDERASHPIPLGPALSPSPRRAGE